MTQKDLYFCQSYKKKNLCCESWQEIYPHTSFFQLLYALFFSEHGRSEAWKSQGFKFFSSFQPLIKKIRFNRERKKCSKLMIQHKTKWSIFFFFWTRFWHEANFFFINVIKLLHIVCFLYVKLFPLLYISGVFLSSRISAGLYFQVLWNLPETVRINIAGACLPPANAPQSGAMASQILSLVSWSYAVKLNCDWIRTCESLKDLTNPEKGEWSNHLQFVTWTTSLFNCLSLLHKQCK